MRLWQFGIVSSVLAGSTVTAFCQTNLLTNGGFEEGGKTPRGWNLSQGAGEWSRQGGTGNSACLSVGGDGANNNAWVSEPVTFLPGRVYRLAFSVRGEKMGGGTVVSGAPFANVDLGMPGKEWMRHGHVFAAPSRKEDLTVPIRLGQWELKGNAFFDDVRLAKVEAVHASRGEMLLGEGEKMEGTRYTFDAPFDSECRNHSRPLFGFTAHYNTCRWCFTAGSGVTYRHALAGRKLLSGTVGVNCGYYISGRLLVDASPDMKTWQHVGVLTNAGEVKMDLPAALFPAEAVYVRLRGAKPPCTLQIHNYRFGGTVDGEPMTFAGSTRYIETESHAPKIRVQVLGLGEGIPGGENRVGLRVQNATGAPLTTEACVIFSRPDAVPLTNAVAVTLPAAGAYDVQVPYEAPGVGMWQMAVSLGDVFMARSAIRVPEFYDDAYGEIIPVNQPKLNLWRASSGWKIPQHRALPRTVAKSLALRVAKNEWEAVQLVVTPNQPLTNVTVSVSDLTYMKNKIPGGSVQVLRVGYVPVTVKTDQTGTLAEWPDPLLPQGAPVTVGSGMNQPFWIRVKAPADIPAGIYRGTVTVQAEGVKVATVLNVEVYGFALPDTLTCETAFGFSPATVWRYHKVADTAQRREVLDKYLRSLGEHRISPYNPAPMDGWTVEWKGLDAKTGKLDDGKKIAEVEPVFNWEAWDAAMTRAFGTYHFNSFVMRVEGLGGGTFHERYEPRFLGYAGTSPEYDILMGKYLKGIETHLREKGWLEKAYVYWFDEPDPKDYAFVMGGFATLKKHAPGLRRMLTEQVEKDLAGGPNLWCPLTPSLNVAGLEERRAAGDRFWWYVCCGPKAPYATEFIDHPGTEMRVWLWQTWAERVTGILIWETVYWTSDTAYPDRANPQNPYLDPMSWTTGYGLTPGTKSAWGNGDGRFLYPPLAVADGKSAQPVLDGPVESLRLELLRDGIEDYEYFVILKRLLAEKGAKLDARTRANLEALLTVPPDVSSSLTRFTRDPATLETHRDKLARAIVELLKR